MFVGFTIYRLIAFLIIVTLSQTPSGDSPLCFVTFDIRWHVNFHWQFANIHLKTILNIIQNFRVSFIRHKRYCQPFCSKPPCTCNLWNKSQTHFYYLTKYITPLTKRLNLADGSLKVSPPKAILPIYPSWMLIQQEREEVNSYQSHSFSTYLRVLFSANNNLKSSQ